METLIHIGFPKTGTTWLQQDIFTQPAFYHIGNNPKEFGWHFMYGGTRGLESVFDFCTDSTLAPLQNKSSAQNKKLVISNEDLCGHPLSGSVQGAQIANNIQSVFPNARILITIRKQETMLRSLYFHYLRRGGVCSFKQFLIPRNEGQVSFFNPASLKYNKIISYYQNLFGKDNVYVLPYEMLLSDLDNYMAILRKFTQIPNISPIKPTQPSNKTDSHLASTIACFRLLNLFIGGKSNNNMRLATGSYHSKTFWRYFSLVTPRVLSMYKQKKIEAIANGFTDYYIESNQIAENLIDINLKQLGYRA